MDSRKRTSRKCAHSDFCKLCARSEQGIAVIFISILLVVLIIFVSLVIDMGRGYYNKRNIQIASDAASLAAVALLDPTETLAANQLVGIQEAREILKANGVSAAEAAAAAIEVGNWTSANGFVADTAPFNSLRIDLTRSVGIRFASVIGWQTMVPRVISVAVRDAPTGAQCVVPFGILDSIVEGQQYGSIIDIGFASPGNWGKLDVGGNMSSGAGFLPTFINGACNTIVQIGDAISPGTGFAQVPNAFQGRLAVNPYIIIPIIDQWPKGNSQPVTVKGFMKFKIIGEGQDGANWSGKLQIVEGFTGTGLGGPTDEPYVLTRALVQ